MSGKDFSGQPSSYFLEMAKFFLFPNHHPWWGEAIPWWYRFLPYGDDPDTSVMELRVHMPLPLNGPAPESAKCVEVDFDEAVASYTQLGVTGYIVDQDMANVAEIQKGMKAAKKSRAFLSLGRYQEQNIQHFHVTYNKLMGIESVPWSVDSAV